MIPRPSAPVTTHLKPRPTSKKHSPRHPSQSKSQITQEVPLPWYSRPKFAKADTLPPISTLPHTKQNKRKKRSGARHRRHRKAVRCLAESPPLNAQYTQLPKYRSYDQLFQDLSICPWKKLLEATHPCPNKACLNHNRDQDLLLPKQQNSSAT